MVLISLMPDLTKGIIILLRVRYCVCTYVCLYNTVCMSVQYCMYVYVSACVLCTAIQHVSCMYVRTIVRSYTCTVLYVCVCMYVRSYDRMPVQCCMYVYVEHGVNNSDARSNQRYYIYLYMALTNSLLSSFNPEEVFLYIYIYICIVYIYMYSIYI
jgi:hypothetical protein